MEDGRQGRFRRRFFRGLLFRGLGGSFQAEEVIQGAEHVGAPGAADDEDDQDANRDQDHLQAAA